MNQEPEAGGAVKPASSDVPDAKQTARIAAQAARLAKKPVADEWDKAGDTSGVNVDPGDRRVAIGVDVGGSGIKAAAVDLDTGELISPRHRVPTPQPSAPAAVDRVHRADDQEDHDRGVGRPHRARRCRLPGRGHRRRHQERGQRRSGLGRVRRGRRHGARPAPAGAPRERRRRGGRRRDAARGGRRPARDGVPDHARNRDGLGAVLQRHARAQPRAGPHGDPGPRRRAAVRGGGTDQARRSAGRRGRRTSTSTCWPSRSCSRPGCSSSVAACPSDPSSSSRA